MSDNWFAGLMKDEVPYEDIAAREDEFHHWNMDPIDLVENGYEGVIDKLKTYTAIEYEKLDEEGKERYVNEVLAIYRDVDVFPIQYFSEVGVMNEISKCIEYPAKFDGNVVSCGAGVGTVVCNYLFPNLFDVPSQHDLTKDKAGAETAYLKFKNDEFLKRSIKFCFSYKNGCPVPTNVMGGLRLVGSTPTNFRPMNAKAIYERFAPKGGTIYDFCCVSGDTEFFNGKEWKRIDQYVDGDMVLQYNDDGTAELVKPIEYIHYESDEPFYEYISDTLPTCLTGNHDVVYRDEESGKLKKVKFEKLLKDKEFFGKNLEIPISCLIKDSKYSVNLDDKTCEVICFLYRKNIISSNFETPYLKNNGSVVEFTDEVFKLDIDTRVRLLKLLRGMFEDSLAKSENDAKLITNLHNITPGFIGSVTYGPFDDSYHFMSCNRGDIDYYFVEDNRDFSCIEYLMGDSDEDSVGLPVREISERHKYCFTVSSHMLVLRRKGQMFVTGNCGFGGRLLGCLSSKNNYRYVGTDPCTETMYNLHRLGEYIEMVTGRDDSYELHCCGSENFRGPANSIDFAFSSPPYFDLEVYSDEETQCFNKFPVLEDWLEGYVRETIKNIYHMLKPGCCYAVNIADFTVKGGREVAYVDEWIRISTEEGMPLYDTVYLGVTARAGTKLQAAGELKKENILIFKKPL